MTPTPNHSVIEKLKDAILDLNEAQARDLAAVCVAHADKLKAAAQAKAREDAQAEIDRATERARAILEAAGLPFVGGKNGKAKPKKAAAKTPLFKAGHRYQHPDDSSKVWPGTGVQPGWVKDLVAKGRMPNDLGPVKDVKPMAAAS